MRARMARAKFIRVEDSDQEQEPLCGLYRLLLGGRIACGRLGAPVVQARGGEEEEGGVDEAGEEKDNGEDGVVFAEVDAAIAGDDAGEMEDVPLESDGGVLADARDRMSVGGVTDDPEIHGFDGESGDQG